MSKKQYQNKTKWFLSKIVIITVVPVPSKQKQSKREQVIISHFNSSEDTFSILTLSLPTTIINCCITMWTKLISLFMENINLTSTLP